MWSLLWLRENWGTKERESRSVSFLVSHYQCQDHVTRENILLPPSGLRKYHDCELPSQLTVRTKGDHQTVQFIQVFPLICQPHVAYNNIRRPILPLYIINCIICAHECCCLKNRIKNKLTSNVLNVSVSLQSHVSSYMWNTAGFSFGEKNLWFTTAVQSGVLQQKPSVSNADMDEDGMSERLWKSTLYAVHEVSPSIHPSSL